MTEVIDDNEDDDQVFSNNDRCDQCGLEWDDGR